MTGTKTSVEESEGSEQLGSKSVPATIGVPSEVTECNRMGWVGAAGIEAPESVGRLWLYFLWLHFLWLHFLWLHFLWL